MSKVYLYKERQIVQGLQLVVVTLHGRFPISIKQELESVTLHTKFNIVMISNRKSHSQSPIRDSN